MNTAPLTGLVAATFTPFTPENTVNFDLIPRLTDHLANNGVAGLYICGSTGEAPSLSIDERIAVTEAYLRANDNRMRAVVHIGHTCLEDACRLGSHAASAGADAISAISPYYFKPPDVASLVGFLKVAAASAPELPFYYYHIPALTGVAINPVDFLRQAGEEIPNLRGIKFTDSDLSLLNACQEVADGRFDVLFGRDEMLLAGLASGVLGAVGSTYNLAPALYGKILRAFAAGNLPEARDLQRKSVRMIRALIENGGEAAIKYPLHRFGLDCGPRRLPMKQLNPAEKQRIDTLLDAMEFDSWAIER
ncbi:MAG: dihydrodipicolinate synthase family protein [Verrucomicrobiae bacterium]|nr:dihydrodipicolinate synthase family protein [Verrucomicrobiae bacterium]